MIAFTGILLGMVSSIIMQTILATVLPGVVKDLGGIYLYSWVFSGYLIASTITIPIFAKLSDLYGRKRFYLGGMVVFVAGSALSGTANSMDHLVIYRVVQGLGAGALAPAAIAMISDLFPIKDRGKMMGMLAIVQVLANVAGPLVGGLIADNLGWQWAFWANIPMGMLAIVLVAFGFAETANGRRQINLGQVDFIGGFLLGVAIILFIQGFKMIETRGLIHMHTVFSLLSAVLVLGGFLWQEKKHSDPVVSPDLMATKNVKISLVSTFLLGAMMYGAIVVLPIYGRLILGETAVQGGKLLLPLALGLGIGGILSAKLTEKFSYANLAVGGWAVATAGFFMLALTSRLELIYYPLAGMVFVTGLGLGVIFPTLLLSGQNAVAENQRAVMGGLVQISRNLGGAIGIPAFTGFIVPTGGNIIGATGSGAYLTLFLLLSMGSAMGVAVGLRFRGSIYTDQKAQNKY